MWVLEARKDAEKVWFPVVWEEKKDTSNIIDYDIHEEITIDTSSVFNANNDTTTGMATVIPWVNAPKLKLSTSIYVDKLEVPSVQQELSKSIWMHRPTDQAVNFRDITTINSWWNNEIVYYDNPQWIAYSWMKMPVEWAYQFNVNYPTWTWVFWWNIEWRTPLWWWSSDVVWRTYTVPRNNSDQNEIFIRKFAKWELFWVFCKMDRSSSTPISVSPTIQMEITLI